jgi:hypothetical protein
MTVGAEASGLMPLPAFIAPNHHEISRSNSAAVFSRTV